MILILYSTIVILLRNETIQVFLVVRCHETDQTFLVVRCHETDQTFLVARYLRNEPRVPGVCDI